jgi:hypothetical protein
MKTINQKIDEFYIPKETMQYQMEPKDLWDHPNTEMQFKSH